MPPFNTTAQQATASTPTNGNSNSNAPQTFDKVPDVDPKTGLHEKSTPGALKNQPDVDLTVSHGILRQSSPSDPKIPLEVGTQKSNLPPEKVFSIQLGSELFRLSGASIASDAPSYFSSFFEEQLQKSDQNATIRTLYIDRDPVIFREICRHLQGYHVQPRTGEEFVRLYMDAQFYSLPRLIGQLFESDVFFQIGERDFQVPKDIFSAPGDSPNFFTLGFNIHFSAPPMMLPGLEKTGLLRPPSIIPPSVPNRSAEVFAQLIHILRGYPVEIKNESHRQELLRDCRYLHFRGVEQKLIPHEISYNPERDCSEIVIRLEDIRQSGVQFVADGSLVDGSTSSGWVYYARPFVDDKPCELIVEIGGQGTVVDLESMRAEFRGLTKARVSSLVQVIANKLNLPNKAPLGLMMMAGGGSRNTTASPDHSPLSEDSQKSISAPTPISSLTANATSSNRVDLRGSIWRNTTALQICSTRRRPDHQRNGNGRKKMGIVVVRRKDDGWYIMGNGGYGFSLMRTDKMASSDIKVTLYWLEQSRAHSILWILEALSIPYTLKTFRRGKDMLAPPELKAVHPLGKSPIITIERPEYAQPLVLAESAAIVEYLLNHFGGEEKGLVPKKFASEEDAAKNLETEEWLRYRFYMHYVEGSLMPQMVMALVVDSVRNAPIPFFLKPIPRLVADKIQTSYLDKQFAVHFPFLESQLKSAPGTTEAHRGGLCGPRFNAADILMSFPMIAATGRGVITQESYPEIVAYAERLKKDDGYQRAVKKIEEVDGKFVASL
ncbi:hypothetical protein TCE0_017f03410 [Talaromyces pinophilus]|uniref:Glutathione S-transferase n=1 Tax=Talaromyces pinophilus TaxID=128442 RepID=A0A6V8H1V5_TALPI|nr:hypothetical protein TCE0_017f03410 [Talaromyces pinophilus]